MSNNGKIFIVRGKQSGKEFTDLFFPISIGRDPSNSIVIDDDDISRFHLRIKQRGQLYILEDLDSTNGTYLNGDRVINSIVKDSDRILIGTTEMVLSLASPLVTIITDLAKDHMINQEEDLGPIPIDIRSMPSELALRIKSSESLSGAAKNPKQLKSLYEYLSHTLEIDSLEVLCENILNFLHESSPLIARGTILTYNEDSKILTPFLSRHFTKQKSSFLLSQKILSETIKRGHTTLIQDNSPHVTQTGRTRLVVPIQRHTELLAILHLELKDGPYILQSQVIEMIEAMTQISAPIMESLLLRQEIDSFMLGMVGAMIAAIEAKDTYTVGHSERVCRYAMAIADELKLNRDIKKMLMISSLCHDLGKIGIPDAILKKASLLSHDEYEEMKLHPVIGADIMAHMPNAKRFISGVKYHHEKWDGTGYPEGLVGEEIPFFGRIVAVADTFDAMISGRSYSGFMEEQDAIHKLAKEVDLFDPEVIKALIKAYDSGSLTLKTSTIGGRKPK